MATNSKIVTCKAPVNMAVIKYWGKRDEELILPINDSISCTLSMDYMFAKTSIMASPDFTQSKFWLNKEEQSLEENRRLQNCLKEIKRKATKKRDKQDIVKWNIHICSENNFPTAAGLASSAAGYACLIKALTELYEVDSDLTALARIGSGSACRSIYSGWVQWCKGSKDDGSDSIAKQITSHLHWPEMRIVILVINDTRKKYSSTSGMKQSVLTSDLLKYRAAEVVPRRIQEMTEAILTKNFAKFAEITMKDSNQFHAICQDTYPPCVYLNDTSQTIINLVHCFNELKGENKVAYTFDAGPNACLFLLEKDLKEVTALVNHCFPHDKNTDGYYRGIRVEPVVLDNEIAAKFPVNSVNSLRYVICTESGEGATVIREKTQHLLNETGTPKFLS